MKPGEFDDLVRQQFDRNDFEYDSRNWDRLAEELDGRGKKKRGLLLWWIPLMGVAASVAMAFGVSKALHQASGIGGGAKTEYAKAAKVSKHHIASAPAAASIADYTNEDAIPAQEASAPSSSKLLADNNVVASATTTEKIIETSSDIASQVAKSPATKSIANTTTSINLGGTFASRPARVIDNNAFTDKHDVLKKKKKAVVLNEGYYTFKEE